MDLRFRKAVEKDADSLAPRLRKADLAEIAAVTGETPLDGLRRSIESSETCYAATNGKGLVLAVFGVIRDEGESDSGFIWLLGAEDLTDGYSGLFARLSRGWIDYLHAKYDLLWCDIDARNQAHIRWLQWCGFECAGSLESHGFEQRLFYKYVHRDETKKTPRRA
jgi:hypothetical protein